MGGTKISTSRWHFSLPDTIWSGMGGSNFWRIPFIWHLNSQLVHISYKRFDTTCRLILWWLALVHLLGCWHFDVFSGFRRILTFTWYFFSIIADNLLPPTWLRLVFAVIGSYIKKKKEGVYSIKNKYIFTLILTAWGVLFSLSIHLDLLLLDLDALVFSILIYLPFENHNE